DPSTCLKNEWLGLFSLCTLCVLCVSVVNIFLRKNNHRDTEHTEFAQRSSRKNSNVRSSACGRFLAGRCVQAQARLHALLPSTLFFFDLFDLREGGAEVFAAQLAHLQIQKRRHDRNQRNDEDVY